MSRISTQIGEALKEYQQGIYERVERQVGVFARDLIVEAIIERKTIPGAHDFTGNLINSIVVCVYKDGVPQTAYYPSQYGVPKAIRFKMTAPKTYHFKKDYSGEESSYTARIKTNEGWGEDDARDFFNSFNPGRQAKFYIVVAYTAEYASFAEGLRRTAGFTATYDYAKRTGWQVLGLLVADTVPTL